MKEGDPIEIREYQELEGSVYEVYGYKPKNFLQTRMFFREHHYNHTFLFTGLMDYLDYKQMIEIGNSSRIKWHFGLEEGVENFLRVDEGLYKKAKELAHQIQNSWKKHGENKVEILDTTKYGNGKMLGKK